MDKCIGLDFSQRHALVEYEGTESSMHSLFPPSIVHDHRFDSMTLKLMCGQNSPQPWRRLVSREDIIFLEDDRFEVSKGEMNVKGNLKLVEYSVVPLCQAEMRHLPETAVEPSSHGFHQAILL